MTRRITFLILIGSFLFAKLIPTPFMTSPIEFQQLTRNITQEYLERNIFSQCHGISLVQMRNSSPEGFLCVISDPGWNRLVYVFGIDSCGERSGRWAYSFGTKGTGDGQFTNPRGLCIDSLTYDSGDYYYIYVADRNNNRVVRLVYDSDDSLITFNSNCITSLSLPSDVACAAISGGDSSYLVLTEQGQDRIRIYRINQNLTLDSLITYGSSGSGNGNFDYPSGIEIVPIQGQNNQYYIYVTDAGNNRVVCLKWNGSTVSWENTYTDQSEVAGFTSVTSSKYYCVYVTAGGLNEVWVFTPGIGELLYKYNPSETPFLVPKCICIYNDEIAVTEQWSDSSGFQYFKIIPEIRDFYPESDTFDALTDSAKINFKVCETAGYLTMLCCDDTIINNQYFEPGTSSVYWDGREGSGKPAIPGTHPIYLNCPGHTVGTAYVTVEGTKITGEITNLHWTTAGNPYVLVDNSYINNDTLTIDPGVLVMGHDTSSCLDLTATLQALGTVNDTIFFTGHRRLLPVEDSTYPGMWDCIRNYGCAEYPSTIKYCQIEYANIGLEMWSDYNVMTDTIKNCYFKENIIPAYCDFRYTGAFGYNNDYDDNDTNKIKVNPAPPAKDKVKVPDIPPTLSSSSRAEKGMRGVTDMTMKDQDIPYWFSCEYGTQFKVTGNEDSAMTLTIEPGIQIEFDADATLEIGDTNQYTYFRGKLICDGLENDTIKLIGVDNGTWKGIRFCPKADISDTSSITYTLIESAGSDTSAIMIGDSTSIAITNSKICNSPNYGLWMAYSSPYDNITVSQCLFDSDSIPILSSFGNLGAIDTCSYSSNLYDRIDVVGQEVVSKNVNIFDYSLPYYFMNQDPFGSIYGLYGNGSLATLTIDPNVNIFCDSAVSIEIGNTDQKALNRKAKHAYADNPARTYRGKITALGNDSMPIIFTAMDMDNPWNGITIYADDSQDTSRIKYCEISHALNGIDIYSTSPVIEHSSIMNTENAVIVSGSGAGPVIDSNLIVLNTCGVYNTDTGSTSLSLSHNDIYGNMIAVKNEMTGNHVDADSNWWGASSGPWDPTDAISGPPDYNPSGRGDSIGDYTVYRHWLAQPVNQTHVTLIFPDGEESLYVEIDTVIQWTRSSGITPVKQELYYTTDFPEGDSLEESALWQFIDTVNVNDTSFTWDVPITPSQRCRVALKLYYETGAKQETSDEIQISLSGSSRRQYSPYEKYLSEEQKYGIRSLYDNPSRSTTTIAVDVSDANFAIVDTVSPQITLDYPTGSEYFIPTTQETILWQASDNHKLDHFNIYLSEDGGSSYPDTIIEDLQAPCSSYIWTVTEKNNYNCKIMVAAFDSSDNDNSDACDSIFYIPVKSFSDEMSAYNNATRMIRSFSANIHLVYSTAESEKLDKNKKYNLSTSIDQSMFRHGKQIRGDKVYYIKSTNFGIAWQSPTEIGEGIYPAISMNNDATKMGATWQNSDQSEIYYRYWTPMGGWDRTDTIFSVSSDITYSPPAIGFMNDTMHLTTIRTDEISRSEIVQDVLYTKFYWSNASATMSLDTVNHWRITYSGDYPQFSSIAADGNNKAHVTWERPPDDTIFSTFTPFDIYYSEQNAPGLSTVTNVSNSDSNSINPSIECYGGHYYIVWQEKVDGYNIFLYKRNYASFPPSSQTDTISQSAGEYPVTSMGGVVLWAAGDTADIFGRIWDSEEEEWLDITNWSNTPRHSMYPQVDAWQDEGGLDIIAGWTEDTDTSGFGKKYVSIFPYGDYGNISLPSYYLDLGDALSTPFTLYRDSFGPSNEILYDVGYDSLVYYLPYIDTNAKCRLYIELYRPGTKTNSRENTKWKIKLNVDGIVHQTIELMPGELKKVNIDIPWMVNIDGSAKIHLGRNQGDCILARRVLFYEYETNSGVAMTGQGGLQNNEITNVDVAFFKGLYPNPTKADIELRFSAPVPQTMNIMLYDVAGRLVDEVFSGKINAGDNNIPIRSTNLAAGIYFIRIETDDETITEKVIILK